MTVVIDLLVDVVDGINEGVQFLLVSFLGSVDVGVVLLLFETHFDRDATAMKEGLAIQVLDGEEGALLIFVVDEGPKLGFF